MPLAFRTLPCDLPERASLPSKPQEAHCEENHEVVASPPLNSASQVSGRWGRQPHLSFENELSTCCIPFLFRTTSISNNSVRNQFLSKMGVVLVAVDNISFLLGCLS